MNKLRLDQAVVKLKLVASRSQAESYIKLGQVLVEGKVITKPGFLVGAEANITMSTTQQYVSRAALKLSSVTKALKLDFAGKTVLDVGSSTGGFTDYALRHGARKVIAVEVGTDQLHPSLRGNPQIELHEKTDIRNVTIHHPELVSGPANQPKKDKQVLKPVQDDVDSKITIEVPDIVVADVSFISLREILPSIAKLSSAGTQIVVMVKPQFEAAQSNLKHKGIIKNDKMRRDILKDFESWTQTRFRIIDKADSEVSGAKGNKERFYLLMRV